MGSVKDLKVLQEPTPEETGRGIFTYSDDYSVFDWGKMPGKIPGKGAALCMVSAYFFESLAMPTHYIGLVDSSNGTRRLDDVNAPCNQMDIELLRVAKPVMYKGREIDEIEREQSVVIIGEGNGRIAYDYLAFEGLPSRTVVPMEFIYRNRLPLGSSVFRRLESGQLKLAEMGLESMPQEGEALPRPFLDVSSKFEEGDRYMPWKEAERLTCLNEQEVETIRQYMQAANNLITHTVGHMRLVNEDGKFEFGFGEFESDTTRRIIVVDALGTLDECRFTYEKDGVVVPVSKEVARQLYKREQSEWVEAVEAAKRDHPGDWRDHVGEPEPLPPEFRDMVGYMYQSVANRIIGRELFDCPSFEEVMDYFARHVTA